MIKLYAAPRTRALRVLWLLEELGLPYDLEIVEFKPTSNTFFIQDTPTGKIPTLEDDTCVICESGAIVQYILEAYGAGRLEPQVKDANRGEFLQWIHYAESSAFGPLGNIVWLTQYRQDGPENTDLVADAISRAQTALMFVETHLTDKDYLLGKNFTAADIMMGFTLLAAQMLGQLGEDVPNLQTYLGRLMTREPLKKAMILLT